MDRDLIFIGRFRSFVEELHDRGLIESRSRRDRAASRDRGVYMVESPPIERTSIDKRPGPRSWPDRGAIVAQSRLDRSPIAAKMHDILMRN